MDYPFYSDYDPHPYLDSAYERYGEEQRASLRWEDVRTVETVKPESQPQPEPKKETP